MANPCDTGICDTENCTAKCVAKKDNSPNEFEPDVGDHFLVMLGGKWYLRPVDKVLMHTFRIAGLWFWKRTGAQRGTGGHMMVKRLGDTWRGEVIRVD